MTLGSTLFVGLLCHLTGDYVLQNHWMANNKTAPGFTGQMAASVHVLLYGMPFALLIQYVSLPQHAYHGLAALLTVVVTHYVIDRYRLAAYWCRFWGVGQPGWLMSQLLPEDQIPADAPPFLGVWLLILVDNIAHLWINSLALYWLLSIRGA